MKKIDAELTGSYEEYIADAKGDETKTDENEKSLLSQILDKMYEEDPQILDKLYEENAKVNESKVGECKIADKPSIFNGLKDDEDEYI